MLEEFKVYCVVKESMEFILYFLLKEKEKKKKFEKFC